MERDTLVRMADKVMVYKYVMRNVARRHGCTVTFMPKPLFGDNGNGMHTHQSLWKDGRNLFYGEGGYAELSPLALHYVAGLLTHVDALLGLTSPTTNSYKRLVPHYEAPVNVAFSKRNRSACVRIPMYYSGPESAASKRIEFRPPDPSCNPYLAFAAMLMAGLDGIRRRMDASRFGPLDVNTYELPPEEAAKVKSVPGSLAAALDALEADHEFLLEGDVFTRDLLETWIAYKRERELHEVNIRPHPYEFYLYYDVCPAPAGPGSLPPGPLPSPARDSRSLQACSSTGTTESRGCRTRPRWARRGSAFTCARVTGRGRARTARTSTTTRLGSLGSG